MSWNSIITVISTLVLSITSFTTVFGADAVPLGRKPVEIVNGQYPASYFPNTELLGSDELRITALGTGMPNQTRAAVSISYLVELGNGDKFLFDAGIRDDGQPVLIAARLFQARQGLCQSPSYGPRGRLHGAAYRRLAFGSLHTDPHSTDRAGPNRNWGPRPLSMPCSKGYAWDLQTRSAARCRTRARKIVVHEFDYKQINAVVYQKNGVTIRSWPAIHSLDGSVSYGLWSGTVSSTCSAAIPIRTSGTSNMPPMPTSPPTSAFLPPKALAKYFGWDLDPGNLCLDADPHRASSLRQGDVGGQAAPGRWLPFGAIAGEQRRDHGWHPQDLWRSAGAGARPDGHQRHQEKNHHRCAWPSSMITSCRPMSPQAYQGSTSHRPTNLRASSSTAASGKTTHRHRCRRSRTEPPMPPAVY